MSERIEVFVDSADDLYILRDQRSRCVKIGRGADPTDRLTQLQTGCPGELVIETVVTGAGWLEPILHRLFAAHVIKGRREWYEEGSPACRLARQLNRDEYTGSVMLALGLLLFNLGIQDFYHCETGPQDAANLYRSTGETFLAVADRIEKNLRQQASEEAALG